MAYIRTVSPDDATGALKEDYDAALARAGRVFRIVEVMSVRPRVLRAFVTLALEVLEGESELSREERRDLAYVVSETNRCRYSSDVYRPEGGVAIPAVLAEFAVKLTRSPGAAAKADVDGLRRAGYSDAAISDAIQTIALLNYANRIADGLGIDLEPAS